MCVRVYVCEEPVGFLSPEGGGGGGRESGRLRGKDGERFTYLSVASSWADVLKKKNKCMHCIIMNNKDSFDLIRFEEKDWEERNG